MFWEHAFANWYQPLKCSCLDSPLLKDRGTNSTFFFSMVVGQDLKSRSLVIKTKQNKSLPCFWLLSCLDVIYRAKALLIFKLYMGDSFFNTLNAFDNKTSRNTYSLSVLCNFLQRTLSRVDNLRVQWSRNRGKLFNSKASLFEAFSPFKRGPSPKHFTCVFSFNKFYNC